MDLATPPDAQPAAAATGAADATDLDLLRRYAALADDAAFAALVERHRDAIYALCRRRLGDPAGADDATQAVFLVLARRARALARGWPAPVVAAWLRRAARLTCANVVRARRRRERHERAAGAAVASASAEMRDGDAARVERELDRLPRGCRDALVLRYLVGKDRDAIARELGIDVEAVKKRLARGLALLRTRLAGASEDATAASLVALVAAGSAPRGAAASPRAHLLAKECLMSMRLPFIASCCAAALVVCAPLAVAGLAPRATAPRAEAVPAAEPPPAPRPAYGLKPGQTLFADVFTVWQMDMPAGVVVPESLPIAEKAVEYSLYRYDVDAVDDEGTATVTVSVPFLALCTPNRGNARLQVDDVVHLPESLGGGDVPFRGELVNAAGDFVRMKLRARYRADGAYAVESQELPDPQHLSHDAGLIAFGIPPWLPPASTGARPRIGFGGDAVAAAVSREADGTVVEDFAKLTAPERHVFDYEMNMGVVNAKAQLFASGSGSGRMRATYAADGVPTHVASLWRFDVTLTPKLGAAAFAALTPRLTAMRDARAVDLATKDPAEVAHALLAARGKDLAALAKDARGRLPAGAPAWAGELMRGAAFGALHGLVAPDAPINVQMVEPAAPAVEQQPDGASTF